MLPKPMPRPASSLRKTGLNTIYIEYYSKPWGMSRDFARAGRNRAGRQEIRAYTANKYGKASRTRRGGPRRNGVDKVGKLVEC